MHKYLIILFVSLFSAQTIIAQENKMIDLQPNEKTIYPNTLGLSGNETMLSLFQVVPELMYSTREDSFENVTIKVNGNKDYLDASAVLRQIRVMDVEKVVIRVSPDAGAGTVGLGGEVNIITKTAKEGFHGNAALEVSTRGLLDPTVNIQFSNDKWNVTAGLSTYWNYVNQDFWYTNFQTGTDPGLAKTEYEDKRTTAFGENANIRAIYSPTQKDQIKLVLVQEYRNIDDKDNYEENMLYHENHKVQKQNNTTAELNYKHFFTPASVFSATIGTGYSDNPNLNNFRFKSMKYSGLGGGSEVENTETNKKYFAQVQQDLQLTRNLSMMACERLEVNDNKTEYDHNIIVTARPDGTGNDKDYLYHTLNSQTRMQLNWGYDKWTIKVGEVLDFFHYGIKVDDGAECCSESFTPQHFAAIGFRNNDHHWFNLSYRRILLRPSQMQLYPLSLTFDNDGKPVKSDGKYRDLANATGNTFSFGYTYNTLKHLTFDTSLSTYIVDNVLNYALDHYEENGRNVLTNLTLTAYLNYGWLMTTIGTDICYALYEIKNSSSYTEKLHYNLRWMLTADLGRKWTLGAAALYNSYQWTTNSETTSMLYADLHVSKEIGCWTLAARLNDIFCPKTTKDQWDDKMTYRVEGKVYDRALSLSAIYKF